MAVQVEGEKLIEVLEVRGNGAGYAALCCCVRQLQCPDPASRFCSSLNVLRDILHCYAWPGSDFLLRRGAGAPSAQEVGHEQVVVGRYARPMVLNCHKSLAVFCEVVVCACPPRV